MKTKKPLLNFILMDGRWAEISPNWEEIISQFLEKTVELLDKDFSSQEVSVVLSDDKHIQDLNKTFRQKDSPTNVLSFDSDIEEELGDIILAYETIMKEAQTSNIPPINHVTHLIIHGFLHLLEYDHEKENEAAIMERMEINILRTLNIKNPYEVL